MRRSYRTDRYLGILERVRTAIPRAAITTDIIVGFPGGTRKISKPLWIYVLRLDLQQHIHINIRRDQVHRLQRCQIKFSAEVVGERYTRLHNHQQEISLSVNTEAIGTVHKILVGDFEGRRDEVQSRLTGRSEDFRLVHFDNSFVARPGE
jgi:tRNA-2-methylthio-N6-dimethylallyladenosine synthase